MNLLRDFKILIGVISAFFLLAFLAMKIEQKYFPEKPPTYRA